MDAVTTNSICSTVGGAYVWLNPINVPTIALGNLEKKPVATADVEKATSVPPSLLGTREIGSMLIDLPLEIRRTIVSCVHVGRKIEILEFLTNRHWVTKAETTCSALDDLVRIMADADGGRDVSEAPQALRSAHWTTVNLSHDLKT
jgi:hypothetical protein